MGPKEHTNEVWSHPRTPNGSGQNLGDDVDAADTSNSSSWLRRFIAWKDRLDQKAVKGIATTVAITVFLLMNQRSGNRRRQNLHKKQSDSNYQLAAEAPLSLLFNSATDGQVKSALLSNTSGGSLVYYLLKNSNDWKKSLLPSTLSSKDLIETLSKSCDNVTAIPDSLSSRLATPVLSALPFLYLFFLYRVLKKSLGIGGSDDVKLLDNRATAVTFADVAGMPQVLAEIEEVARYLSHPESYTAIGARPPRAILLHGEFSPSFWSRDLCLFPLTILVS